MTFKEFNTGINDIGRRADRVLRKFLPHLPLSQIYALMRSGKIKINQKKIKPDYRIVENDIFFISENSDFFVRDNININKKSEITVDSNNLTQKQTEEYQVLFKNEHIIFINKPYNITVHGSNNSLNVYIETKYAQTNSLSFTPGPLHRLDKKTTGVLAFSQSLQGAKWFSEQLQNNTITKKYIGIAQGHLKQSELWQDSLQKNDKKNGFYTVERNEAGKTAQTQATPIACGVYQNKPVTLTEYVIFTGRTHQIRAQSALHGFPLLGDSAYNSQITLPQQEFFLHALELELPPNNYGIPQKIKAPIGNAFTQFCLQAQIPCCTFLEKSL